MAEIVLDGVTKVFGDVIAVNAVSLEVDDGEFMVLVGPSGCGKSTILRMIAGLEEVTAGEISIGGEQVTDLEPKLRDIAMVFQNYALYPHMTVEANLGFGLKLRHMPKDGATAPGRTTPPRSSASKDCCIGSPRSCPAGSASVSRSAARWCASRRPS